MESIVIVELISPCLPFGPCPLWFTFGVALVVDVIVFTAHASVFMGKHLQDVKIHTIVGRELVASRGGQSQFELLLLMHDS